MSAPARFAIGGVALLAIFGIALGIGTLVGDTDDRHDEVAAGLSESESGYTLADLTAPAAVGESGTLRFRVTGPDGAAVTEFTTQHEKKLHLIVVRSDGSEFRHEHPVMDPAGVWSIDWSSAAPGTYRAFADFVPGTPDSPGDLVLSDTFTVAGPVTERPLPPVTDTVTVDGYQVARHGDLTTGGGEVHFTVTRDGKPVTDLEPYLGANGHLVALRAEDLAYLHVHPQEDGSRGPGIAFHAQAPSTGAYHLYLDFAHGGSVHTAEFTVQATESAPPSTESGHDDHGGHGGHR